MTDLDAQQELAFIKKVMTDSRKILIDDYKGTIFWGILISFGLLITYLSVAQRWESTLSWFWPALIGFGWIYTIVTEIRRERKRRVKTFCSLDCFWNISNNSWFCRNSYGCLSWCNY